ncbi:hypothetical protein SEA_FAUST_119 [Streptomyces phage Faust]|uniref:Uncharacterized protein n=1 Tax=Streptomyces phage Faust TaxID=2767565 RepID=A0A7G9UYV5_9CAUD|nr:hypothetical protein PP456_gp149 [Streptomyces phage Faust]QNN99210.1 hypothetical protein SEA_FAUST_119 [Streptomyces phage Faust]
MVNLDKVYYEAQSRIEAESWINSTGRKHYPELKFRYERRGSKWLVKKK